MSSENKTNRMTLIAAFLLMLFLVGAGGAGYYYNQNSGLQSQVSSLQSTINSQSSILSLSESQTEANQVTVNQNAGARTTVVSFSAQYAGQIKITGTSTTTNGYIVVTEGNGFSQQDSFGTGTTVYVNIVPGTVAVTFGNSNFGNGATATITVVYIY